MPAAVLLLFALTVSRDAVLRASCDASDDAVATVAAGTPVEIRFAVSDGSNCYKVAATVGGKEVVGYVSASVLSDTSAFERDRKGGTALDSGRAPAETNAAIQSLRVDPRQAAIVELLKSHEPARALERAETLLKNAPHD